MNNRTMCLTLIVLMTAAHACVAAPPPPPPAPAAPPTVIVRPAATAPATYELAFPSRVELPTGGVLMLDNRPATEKAAFLGVSVSTVTGALRNQLKLKPGVGLLVNHVEADSPAAAAGVKQYDIIEKLDDQLLVEPRQLSVLIRLRKDGDSVKLSLIREAQPQTVSAKLVEKDLPALEDVLVPAQNTPWRTIAPFGRAGGELARIQPSFGSPEAGEVAAVSGLNWSDGDVTMEILQDKARHLTARTKDGVLLYDGAIDTPEQIQKLPPEIRAKTIRLMKTPTTGPTTAAATMQPQNVQYRNTVKTSTFNRTPAGGSPAM